VEYELIDLSVPLEPPVREDGLSGEELDRARLINGGMMSPSVTFHTHEETAPNMARMFGCQPEDFPNGLGWASETVTLGSHTGTHFDAPWHYGPTCEGRRAPTIDEIPLEYCYGDGVVLDLRHKNAGELITVADLKEALARIPHELAPGNIVFLMTGRDKYWGTLRYFEDYPGMGREGTLWLATQGIRLMGTDAIGWDRPFRVEGEEFARTGDKSVLWGGHYVGMEKEYYHIEKLANLDLLPPVGFQVAAFPVRLVGASAGWVRPVALVRRTAGGQK
jgi:kynurenine formamidase